MPDTLTAKTETMRPLAPSQRRGRQLATQSNNFNRVKLLTFIQAHTMSASQRRKMA
jgi:hypothetical protein